jgi:hypothetical protein
VGEIVGDRIPKSAKTAHYVTVDRYKKSAVRT